MEPDEAPDEQSRQAAVAKCAEVVSWLAATEEFCSSITVVESYRRPRCWRQVSDVPMLCLAVYRIMTPPYVAPVAHH